MGEFTAADIKNILYILPVLSGLLCLLYVRSLRKRAVNESVASPGWRGMDLFGNTGGAGGPVAGGHSIALGGGGGGSSREQELMPVDRHVGLVIEYNDSGLEAHAKKAKISQSQRTTRRGRSAAPRPHPQFDIVGSGAHLAPRRRVWPGACGCS